MTDEEKFWFVVRELGDYAKKVPVTVLRAIQLIGLKEAEVLRSECAQLKQRVSELEVRVGLLETYTKHIGTGQNLCSLRENSRRSRREQVIRTLQECQGNFTKASEILGVNKATIYRIVPSVCRVINEQKNYTGQVQSDTVQA